MELFLELLMNGTIIKWIIAGGGCITAIGASFIKGYKALEKYRKLRNDSEEKDALIDKTINDVDKLKTDMADVIQKVDNLLIMLQTERDERLKRDRAKLKKDIKEIYQKCNITKTITHMDINTLEDLIEEYEAAGGKNSFVHTTVQKEMYTWEEVDD